MKTVNFTQHLLSLQSELFRFAFKLTADREDANDLLQETSLKALDNEDKYTPDTNMKGLRANGAIFLSVVFGIEAQMKAEKPTKNITLEMFKDKVDTISQVKCWRA